MLSVKLVQLVEDHWELISARILRKIQSDPRLAHVGKLPESELRQRAQEILNNIGDWLGSSQDESFVRHCEALGRQRLEEGIPLHEVVLARFFIKDTLIEFVREHAFSENTVELYAEGELEKRVGQFFDRMIYYVVRGYEEAMREAARHVFTASTRH
jgi:hypothetical protein